MTNEKQEKTYTAEEVNQILQREIFNEGRINFQLWAVKEAQRAGFPPKFVDSGISIYNQLIGNVPKAEEPEPTPEPEPTE